MHDLMTRAALLALTAWGLWSARGMGQRKKGTRPMKTKLALIALLVAMACAVNASAAMILTGNLAHEKVSSTQANTVVTFPTNPAGGGDTNQDSVVFANAGPNEVFVALGEVATTSKAELPAGHTLTLTGRAARIATAGIICSTGETATVYVYATYP